MIGMSSSLVFLFPPLTIAKILCILAVSISILSIFEKLIGYSLGWHTLIIGRKYIFTIYPLVAFC